MHASRLFHVESGPTNHDRVWSLWPVWTILFGKLTYKNTLKVKEIYSREFWKDELSEGVRRLGP